MHSLRATANFRLPTFVNGNTDGMLIEACADLLDDDAPEDRIARRPWKKRVTGAGGGVAREQKEIEVLKLGHEEALVMIARGEVRN